MSSKKAKRRKRSGGSGAPGAAAGTAVAAGTGASAPAPSSANKPDASGDASAKKAGAGASAPNGGILDRLAAASVGGAARKRESGEPAGMGRRFLAYLIDWYAGALITNIPISIAAGALVGNALNQRLADLGPAGMLVGAAALVCAVGYYVLVPLFVWRGQTPAKRLLGLRIDGLDGEPAGARELVLRQVVGLIVIEGVLAVASSVWHQMLAMATGIDFVTYLMYAGYAAVAVSVGMMLVTPGHRCLHDYIGSTRVDVA